MSFLKLKGFKYIKNLIIGFGVLVVLMGVFFKLESWEGVFEMLIIGLFVEVFIFFFFGFIGFEFDYYWDKLYLGLSDYSLNIVLLMAGGIFNIFVVVFLNGEVVEQQFGGMFFEL